MKKDAVEYKCDIYMCSPSTKTSLALDGVTYIPIAVKYTIWYQDEDKKRSVTLQEIAKVKLVYFEDVLWNEQWAHLPGSEGTPLTLLTDSNFHIEVGWDVREQRPNPDTDVIKGDSGCNSITPASSDNDLRTYITRTFYVRHTYATQSIIDANFNTQTIAAEVSDDGYGTWSTTKSASNPVTNAQHKTLSLSLLDGTPELTLYLKSTSGHNTIISNDHSLLAIDLNYKITSTEKGSTGQPLSIQAKNSSSKLVVYDGGADLNGYVSGPNSSYGTWKVADSGVDNSQSQLSGEGSCQGCGESPLSNPAVSRTFYVSHSPSFIKSQGVAIAVSVSYSLPMGNAKPQTITWSSDSVNGTPERCCFYVTALSQNQEEKN